MNQHTVLERLSLLTPLGVRFMDAATERPVTQGLNVTIYPLLAPRRRVSARQSPSGVYSFHGVPGLGSMTGPTADEDIKAFWERLEAERAASPAGNGSRYDFRLEVSDAEQRFLPLRLTLKLPQPGIFTWPSPNDAAVPGPLPLFSAPGRRTPSGMTLLHFSLKGERAAWAQLGITSAGLARSSRPYRALADARGCVAFVLPYPRPDPEDPSKENISLSQERWPLTLRAVAGPEPHKAPSAADPAYVPDLAELDALWQGAAVTLKDGLDAQTITTVTLAYGHERAFHPQSPETYLTDLYLGGLP